MRLNKITIIRFKAFVIDYGIAVFITSSISLFMFGIKTQVKHFDLLDGNKIMTIFSTFVLHLVNIFVPVMLKDIYRGQSVGKMYYNLKVINIDKQTVSIYKYILRNITLFFNIDGFFLVFTNRRLGDWITKTTVVSKEEKEEISTEKIFFAIFYNFLISFLLIFSLSYYFSVNGKKNVNHKEIDAEKESISERNLVNSYPNDIDSCSVLYKKVKYKDHEYYVSVLVYVDKKSLKFRDKQDCTPFFNIIKDEITNNIPIKGRYFLHIQCKQADAFGLMIMNKSYTIPAWQPELQIKNIQ